MTIALAAMISAASMAAPATLDQWEEMQGMPTPTGSFLMENGNRGTLADFKGQVVVLNLWATWCTPCLKELPTLDKIEETHAADGLVVLPLSVDTLPFDQLRGFLDKQKLELPHLAQDDNNSFQRALNAGGLPITYLMDRDGTIVARYAGAMDWTGKEPTARIGALLKAETR